MSWLPSGSLAPYQRWELGGVTGALSLSGLIWKMGTMVPTSLGLSWELIGNFFFAWKELGRKPSTY